MNPGLWAALAAFAWLVAGVAPGLHWFDSGELVAAAHHLGVSHPPGQPAWTLLAKAAELLLPLGPIPFRMAVLSAAAGAAAIGVAVHAASRHAQVRGPALAFVALAAGGHPFLAAQATRPEVYAPTLLLAALAALACARAAGGDGAGAPAGRPGTRPAAAAALLAGLLAATHPLLGGAAALAGAAWLLAACGPRTVVRAAPLALVGPAAYLLLPVRTAAGAALAWGRPDTWDRFVAVVGAADYRINYDAGDAAGLAERASGHLSLFLDSFGLPVALLALAGVALCAARRPLPTLLVAGVASATTAASVTLRVFLPENPDIHGYLAPAALALALAAGVAAGRLWDGLLPYGRRRAIAAPALVLIGALPALGRTGAPLEQAGVRLPEVLVGEVLRPIPPHGAALVASDHLGFGAMYARLVEGARPDADVAIQPLMASSWHRRDLRRAAGGDGRRTLVEQVHHLDPADRPGAWTGLLVAPGRDAAGAADVPVLEGLERLQRLSGAAPTDRFLRYHAKLLAHQRLVAARPDDAVRACLFALGADPRAPLPPPDPAAPPTPSRYRDVPRLVPVLVSDEAEVRTLLADALAVSGRPAAAARLWDSPEGRSDARMGLLSVHHLFARGDRAAAQAAGDRLLRAFPAHRTDILYNLGVFYAREGVPEAARMQFSTLLLEAPDHPRADLARRYLARLTGEAAP